MGLKADDLRDGLLIAFRCVKAGFPDLFLRGLANGGVVPTRAMTDDGTQWLVHETPNSGVFSFESTGKSLLLEGRTSVCGVGAASGSSEGTNWKVADFSDPDPQDPGHGFGHVSLQCQSAEGSCSLGFLDVSRQLGTVFGVPGYRLRNGYRRPRF